MVRVKVKFTSVDVPLFPAHPLAPLAWSELLYDAYYYVSPDFQR
jgi:hypothetical protein